MIFVRKCTYKPPKWSSHHKFDRFLSSAKLFQAQQIHNIKIRLHQAFALSTRTVRQSKRELFRQCSPAKDINQSDI